MDGMRIRVKTTVLEQRADAVEKQIHNVRNGFDKIRQIVNASTGYWEGKAHEAHRREFREYQDDIEESLMRFQENVTDLRKIAGIYQENEKAVTEISKNLPVDIIM